MDWANEPYVRLYTRETTDDLELSFYALALWRALLTKFDRSGLMEARNGWASVAKAVRGDVAEVERAGAELVRDGRVRLVPSGVFAPNFVEAQTASKSDKARQRESRDRRRSRAESSPDVQSVPSNQAVTLPVSQPVTSGHTASQDVTLCFAELAVAEPLRCVVGAQEEPALRLDSEPLAELKATVDAAAQKAKRDRGTRIPADWKPRTEERAWASEHGVDVEAEAAHFRDHHTARGTTFKDWDAGFRTWLRNAVKFGRSKPQASGQSALDVALAVARGQR